MGKTTLGKFFFYAMLVGAFLLLPTAFALAATTVGNNVSVGGTLTISGHTTVGNATSTDILYVNSRVASSIVPTANDSIDLGEYSRAYNNIFASGTAYLSGVTTTQIAPWANNASDLGNFDFAWNDIFASGTTYVAALTVDGNTTIGNATSDTLTITARLAADLDPSSNNARDFGTFGLAYKDVFASGTIYSASSTIFNPATSSTLALMSDASGKGGQIIFEDVDGAGCTAIVCLNGSCGMSTVTCPVIE